MFVMKRTKLIAATLVASLMAGAVYAEDVIVTENETLSGTIDGNVIVLETGVATLIDVVVNGDVLSLGGEVSLGQFLGGTVELIRGDVKIEAGGRLSARPFRNASITIEGDVKADGAFSASLRNTVVYGDFKVNNSGNNGGGTFGFVGISSSVVGGDVKLEGNFPFTIEIGSSFSASRGNTILGDVKVADNSTLFDFVIQYNDIDGDLKCSGNEANLSGGGDPNPLVANNVVLGDIKCDN